MIDPDRPTSDCPNFFLALLHFAPEIKTQAIGPEDVRYEKFLPQFDVVSVA